MHHLLVIPQHHVANILDSDVDTVKQLEKAAFDFLKSDPDAQRLKVIEKQDFDMGFHRPPFNSKHHLHLHVVYPVSKMSPSQKKRIRNPGFIHVHKWLGTEFKTDSNVDKARPCIICQLAKSGNTAKNSKIVWSDEGHIVVRDRRPVAKNHFLLCPKEHSCNISTASLSTIVSIDRSVRLFLDALQPGVEDKDILLGFHRPEFIATLHHLHLHIIFPASSIRKNSQTRFQEQNGWIKIHDLIAELGKKLNPY